MNTQKRHMEDEEIESYKKVKLEVEETKTEEVGNKRHREEERIEEEVKETKKPKFEEPFKKRSVVQVNTIKLADFSFNDIRIVQEGDFLQFIASNGQPIYLEMNPGGVIPRKIGLKRDEYGHLKICFNVENEEDQKHLRRLDAEFKAIALIHNESWRKIARRPVSWEAKFSSLLPESKMKPGQTKRFSPLFNADFSEDDFNARKLRVRNREDTSTLIRDKSQISGSKMCKFVFEISGARLGNEKSGGIAKKAKTFTIEKDTDFYEYVYAEDILTHNPSCPYKHIIPIDLRTFDFDRDADLQPMDFTEMEPGKHRVPSARMVLKGTDCPLYLRATGGGLYPKFAVSYNKDFKTYSEQFTFGDDEEKEAIKRLELWLKKKSIELRDIWFPNSPRETIPEDGGEPEGIDDKIVKSWVKGILAPPAKKKDKEKKVIEGQFWPANAKLGIDKNDFTEPHFSYILDENGEKIYNDKKEPICHMDQKGDPIPLFHLKPDSKYRVVDVDDNRVTDLSQLAFQTWQTKDFHIRNVYLQKDKTKFATTTIYTKLGHSKADFEPREDQAEEEEGTRQEEE